MYLRAVGIGGDRYVAVVENHFRELLKRYLKEKDGTVALSSVLNTLRQHREPLTWDAATVIISQVSSQPADNGEMSDEVISFKAFITEPGARKRVAFDYEVFLWDIFALLVEQLPSPLTQAAQAGGD